MGLLADDPPPPTHTHTQPVIYRVGVRAEHLIKTYLEYRFGVCTLEFHRRCIHIPSHHMLMCEGWGRHWNFRLTSPPPLQSGGAWLVRERGLGVLCGEPGSILTPDVRSHPWVCQGMCRPPR
jgi:hypothetical protein